MNEKEREEYAREVRYVRKLIAITHAIVQRKIREAEERRNGRIPEQRENNGIEGNGEAE